MSTPKLLPVTNVLLPSSDWALVHFRVSPNTSVKNMSFSSNLSHKPTKTMRPVWNLGEGEGTEFGRWQDWEESVKASWESFVNECLPLARQAGHETANAEQSVTQLFVDELIQQANFKNIIGTVVRTEDGDRIYFEDVEDVPARSGDRYWDPKAKNWVLLPS